MNIMSLSLENEILQDTLEIKDLYIECMNIEYTNIIHEDSKSFLEKVKNIVKKIIEMIGKVLKWIKTKLSQLFNYTKNHFRILKEKLKSLKNKKNEDTGEVKGFKGLSNSAFNSMINNIKKATEMIDNFNGSLYDFSDIRQFFTYTGTGMGHEINYIDRCGGFKEYFDLNSEEFDLSKIDDLYRRIDESEKLVDKLDKIKNSFENTLTDLERENKGLFNKLNSCIKEDDATKYIKTYCGDSSFSEKSKVISCYQQCINYIRLLTEYLTKISKVTFIY